MSREILFRGKTNDGQWLEGDLIQYADTSQIWVQTDEGKWNFVVDPATVGQYVFLEDTKDKKIFTGDILKDPDREGIYVIDFIGGGFGLFTMKEYLDLKHRHTVILWDGLSEPQTACFVTQNLEVIGNIHDNLELAKEEAV